jgi:hypothetical protein
MLLGAAGVAQAAAYGAGIPVSCPAAPTGWTSSSAGPQDYGPEQNPGSDLERITCIYVDAKKEQLSVALNYALPSDLNPYSDFDYGCGTGAIPWSNSLRDYQVVSTTLWADATFDDPLDLTSAANVPQFEGVAQQLMKQAHGLAQSCALNVKPTQTSAGWLFDFEFDLNGNGVIAYGGIGTHVPASTKIVGVASYAIPDGSLQTKGSQSHPSVTGITSPDVKITVLDHGKIHTVTIEFTKGLSFKSVTVADGTVESNTLDAQVKVIHSTLSTCPRGSLGTLSLATAPPTVKLGLCGPVFAALTSRKPEVTIQSS